MPSRYEVDLSALTFGELLEFVRRGVEWGVPDETTVDLRYDDAQQPTALVLERPAQPFGGRMLLGAAHKLDGWADALDAVVEAEGDARGHLGDLAEVRDLLRGLPERTV
jgi:hypothetical protein